MNTSIDHLKNIPTFSDIDIKQVPSTIKEILTTNKTELAELLQQTTFNWQNLMQPLDNMNDRLHQYWARISHMNAVINSDALRKAYNECLPLLSQYYTEFSHNRALFEAIQSIHDSPSFSSLNTAQQKVITNLIRDFKLAGVALNDEDKKQFAELSKELTQLSAKYEENLLDATNAWETLITDEHDIEGIPAHAVTQAKLRAEAKGKKGWLFNLEMPSYLAVIMHADKRELRKEINYAYSTRASDQGPFANKWNNDEIMTAILAKRLALAKLLGFNNFAEESLATKMVKTPGQVLSFLNQLADASLETAKAEYQTLAEFSKSQLNIDKLEAWDITYASEKLRQHQHNFSQELLRPYFKEENVINGLFAIVKQLFKIDIRPVDNIDSWHSDARCYALFDQSGALRSYCYFDLYARPNKRGGAWMDDCQIRRQLDSGEIQTPIAFVTCNFNPPTNDQPALFSHDEVVTLFHEFGHALQHMLTTINYSDVSGINGIPWDAVELASQFLENWAWQKESLDLFAKHHETNEPLPDELFNNMMGAKNFQSALQMLRQLEFALFDFKLHMEFDPQQENQIQAILDNVREHIAITPVAPFNRFQNGFAHIFAGGYAAGYYSYKWAEVMSADAFSLFLEKGIFDQETAERFLTYILEPGGSEEPAVLFKNFRGHDPRVEALLQQSGISH